MKLLPLVWKNIWRRKIRTIFTLLSVFVAFVLYGILRYLHLVFVRGEGGEPDVVVLRDRPLQVSIFLYVCSVFLAVRA